MSHLDPELAALIAMGEHDAATDEQSAHLAECLECADEVAAFAMAAGAARGALADQPLLTPPSHVWDAIAAEVGLTAAAPHTASPAPQHSAPPHSAPQHSIAPQQEIAPQSDAPTRPTRPPAGGDAAAPTSPPASGRTPMLGGGGQSPDPSPHDAAHPAASHRVPRRRRLRRLPVMLALAGTFAVVAVLVGVWAVQDAGVQRPQVVAEATLDGFPAHEGARGAALLEDVDGHTRVVVTLDASVPDDGYREVWLLADDGSDLVSLGVLEGREGTFDVPADVDLDRFTVVDVSQEFDDGDPGHSGDSIVRGALQPA